MERTVDDILDEKLDRKIQSKNQALVESLTRNTSDTKEIKEKLEKFIDKEEVINEKKKDADFHRDMKIAQVLEVATQGLEQGKKTNGYVARHEEALNKIVPEIHTLMTDRNDMMSSRKKSLNMWIERIIYLALTLAFYVLIATGILHIPLR